MTSKLKEQGDRRPISPTGEKQRERLIAAAYDIIVRHGFEGLRTRDIAATVGINIATLHYYFPTKDKLINAVADFLANQFITVHGPAVKPLGSIALTRLHQEFSDARLYHVERRDMIIALQEFSLRARRDPETKSIMERFMHFLKIGLKEMIEIGIKEGVFDPSHDPQTAALFVSSALSGALMSAESMEHIESIFVEIEDWLTGKIKKKSARR